MQINNGKLPPASDYVFYLFRPYWFRLYPNRHHPCMILLGNPTPTHHIMCKLNIYFPGEHPLIPAFETTLIPCYKTFATKKKTLFNEIIRTESSVKLNQHIHLNDQLADVKYYLQTSCKLMIIKVGLLNSTHSALLIWIQKNTYIYLYICSCSLRISFYWVFFHSDLFQRSSSKICSILLPPVKVLLKRGLSQPWEKLSPLLVNLIFITTTLNTSGMTEVRPTKSRDHIALNFVIF